MKTYQKLLATGAALLTILGTNACGEAGSKEKEKSKPTTLEGTVVEEFGLIHNLLESKKRVTSFSDDNTYNTLYGIVLNTKKGEYIFTIREHKKSLITLAKAIEPGKRDKIKINLDTDYTDIFKDLTGITYSKCVEVLPVPDKSQNENYFLDKKYTP